MLIATIESDIFLGYIIIEKIILYEMSRSLAFHNVYILTLITSDLQKAREIFLP
jgi:hypothetical protein